MILIDFILNIDTHLTEIVANYGGLTYLILFIIIFIETGVVIMPFLPGDSLIFAASALAASKNLNIFIIFIISFVAAVIGDTVNFHIGKYFSDKSLENSKLIKKKYLRKTEEFFDRHGGKSIILSRFVPIIRTFAPFVAGIGKMKYFRFLTFNVVGAFFWVLLFCIMGFLFGNIPFVSEHFSLVVLAIIFISAIPVGITILKTFIESRRRK